MANTLESVRRQYPQAYVESGSQSFCYGDQWCQLNLVEGFGVDLDHDCVFDVYVPAYPSPGKPDEVYELRKNPNVSGYEFQQSSASECTPSIGEPLTLFKKAPAFFARA